MGKEKHLAPSNAASAAAHAIHRSFPHGVRVRVLPMPKVGLSSRTIGQCQKKICSVRCPTSVTNGILRDGVTHMTAKPTGTASA